jgi:hypothetical protein
MPVTEVFYANHGKPLNRTGIPLCIDHEENILLPVLVKISPNSTVPDQVSKIYQNIPSIQFKKTVKISKLPESPHKYKIWYYTWMYSGNFQNSGVLGKSYGYFSCFPPTKVTSLWNLLSVYVHSLRELMRPAGLKLRVAELYITRVTE